MMRPTTTMIAWVLMTLLCCSYAYATSDRSPGEDWKGAVTANPSWITSVCFGSTSGSYYTGATKFMFQEYENNSDTAKSSPYAAWAYCIDDAAMQTSDWYQKFTGGIPSPNIQPITHDAWGKKVYLFDHYGWGSLSSYGTTLTAAQNQAAFQLATWEIINDATLDLADGWFKVSNANSTAVLDRANWYLNQVKSIDGSTIDIDHDMYYVATNDDGTGQNFNTVVPEPGSIVAALSILGPVGFVFRRKK